MTFVACPNCKYIWFEWNKDLLGEKQFTAFTNHVMRQKDLYGLTCPMCYAEMKIVEGTTPKTCHHGISENARCRLCSNDDLEAEIERLNNKKKHK